MIPNTFGIQATADSYVVIRNEAELLDFLQQGTLLHSPFFILGGGSNIVFTQHFRGTVLHLDNKGILPLADSDTDTDPDAILIQAAAGEQWDTFVRHCIAHGWHGAENLVAIPGTVGASPVQNVGAYGVEAKDIIHSVRALEIATGRPRIFTNHECRFAYRNSIFKNELKNQYIVTSVTFRLHKTFRPNIGYKAVSDALAQSGITQPTALQLADTIAAVRWSKLPRPEQVGSAGSFFKNPIVSAEQYAGLKEQYPDMVAYPAPDGYKLAAGWLIEHAGWKGRTLGRCGVYEKQALVLVNRGGCTGSEVLALADAITSSVQQTYGVTLEKEAIIV